MRRAAMRSTSEADSLLGESLNNLSRAGGEDYELSRPSWESEWKRSVGDGVKALGYVGIPFLENDLSKHL